MRLEHSLPIMFFISLVACQPWKVTVEPSAQTAESATQKPSQGSTTSLLAAMLASTNAATPSTSMATATTAAAGDVSGVSILQQLAWGDGAMCGPAVCQVLWIGTADVLVQTLSGVPNGLQGLERGCWKARDGATLWLRPTGANWQLVRSPSTFRTCKQ